MRLQTVEKSYQKNAWILIAGVGVLGTIFGLMLMLGVVYDPTYFSNQLGQQVSHFSSTDPRAWSAIQSWERDEGTELFGFSLFAAAIASTAYRRGERWAWYVLVPPTLRTLRHHRHLLSRLILPNILARGNLCLNARRTHPFLQADFSPNTSSVEEAEIVQNGA